MAIRKILIPTDFSESARHAFDVALKLAPGLHAELHLLHVFQVPVQVTAHEAVALPVSFFEELRESAKRKLGLLRDEAVKVGAKCTTHLQDDAAAHAIVASAKELGVDLVVMGSRGLTGLKHVLLGSVAERTVRGAHCPVLTVKRDEQHSARLKTVLVPTDFSVGSERALDFALELAAGAEPVHVILMHSFHVPIELEALLLQQGAPLLERLSEHSQQQLEQAFAKLRARGVSAEYLTRRGVPEAAIIELAAERNVDLVAMGTHGRRGVSHLLLGSVAERVMRGVGCPVLTVRDPS